MLLMSKYLIFDYATEYRNKHDNIASAKEFVLADEDFGNFVKYIEGKDYHYNTDTENAIEEMIKKAKEEKYYDGLKAQIEELNKSLKSNKNEDITKFKNEILEYWKNNLLEVLNLGKMFITFKRFNNYL